MQGLPEPFVEQVLKSLYVDDSSVEMCQMIELLKGLGCLRNGGFTWSTDALTLRYKTKELEDDEARTRENVSVKYCQEPKEDEGLSSTSIEPNQIEQAKFNGSRAWMEYQGRYPICRLCFSLAI